MPISFIVTICLHVCPGVTINEAPNGFSLNSELATLTEFSHQNRTKRAETLYIETHFCRNLEYKTVNIVRAKIDGNTGRSL